MYNQEQYPMQSNSEFAPMNHMNTQFDDSNQKLYYQGSQ